MRFVPAKLNLAAAKRVFVELLLRIRICRAGRNELLDVSARDFQELGGNYAVQQLLRWLLLFNGRGDKLFQMYVGEIFDGVRDHVRLELLRLSVLFHLFSGQRAVLLLQRIRDDPARDADGKRCMRAVRHRLQHRRARIPVSSNVEHQRD
jgi:hypothetical protein